MPDARSRTPHRNRWIRAAALAGLALLATGCASLKHVRSTGKGVVAPAPGPSVQKPPATAAKSLSAIINDELQHGRYDQAAADLRRYLADHPDSRLARSLLRQAQADPQAWLGEPGAEHRVLPGESYSTLAQRYLGDANLFVILARYNGSTDPSRLQAGQSLRIPARTPAGQPAPTAPASEPPQDRPTDATAVAESVADRSARRQREALDLLDAGRTDEALTVLDQALAEDPQLASDRGATAPLRTRLIAACHQRAIVLYRDQRLAPAIGLWDRVLAIDPSYEPAVAYRARARELQQRLKQL